MSKTVKMCKSVHDAIKNKMGHSVHSGSRNVLKYNVQIVSNYLTI